MILVWGKCLLISLLRIAGASGVDMGCRICPGMPSSPVTTDETRNVYLNQSNPTNFSFENSDLGYKDTELRAMQGEKCVNSFQATVTPGPDNATCKLNRKHR